MQTWNVGNQKLLGLKATGLSLEETRRVTGGIGPLAVVVVQAAIGAAHGAASAHSSGASRGKIIGSALVGAVGGSLGGAGGVLWKTSKVLSVTLIGAGASIIGAGSYGMSGPGDRYELINHR